MSVIVALMARICRRAFFVLCSRKHLDTNDSYLDPVMKWSHFMEQRKEDMIQNETHFTRESITSGVNFIKHDSH